MCTAWERKNCVRPFSLYIFSKDVLDSDSIKTSGIPCNGSRDISEPAAVTIPTCKPNACENNQLYVLFAPEGRDAWGMLATPETGVTWLGRPDQRIQDAITHALRK